VVCLAPRALKDSVRPRRPSRRSRRALRVSIDVSAACASARPLNFTVRRMAVMRSALKERLR
jgi:hypothetical protein